MWEKCKKDRDGVKDKWRPEEDKSVKNEDVWLEMEQGRNGWEEERKKRPMEMKRRQL